MFSSSQYVFPSDEIAAELEWKGVKGTFLWGEQFAQLIVQGLVENQKHGLLKRHFTSSSGSLESLSSNPCPVRTESGWALRLYHLTTGLCMYIPCNMLLGYPPCIDIPIYLCAHHAQFSSTSSGTYFRKQKNVFLQPKSQYICKAILYHVGAPVEPGGLN